MNAATIIVKLPHCVWRDGKPRFVPGPALRALGFTGRDLKHPDGRFLDLLECQAWLAGLQGQIGERRQRREAGKRLPPLRLPNAYCVADLFRDLFQEPKFQGASGNRVKPLSRATIRNYHAMADALMAYDTDIWLAPLQLIDTPKAYGLYEALYREKGLHMARHVIATLRMAWSWARRKGKARDNPFKDLGMETPQGRVRSASPAAIRHFIATCDSEGRAEVGDMILLAILTSQRQADRLALEGGHIDQGRFRFLQSKTRKRISGPVVPALAARLEAARSRRKGHKVQWPQVVIDERAEAPWKPDHYRHVFASLRDKAAETLPELAGLRDQDLRDTAITWARDGGAGFEDRRKLTGHSQQSAALEEKHYLAGAESHGDAAVAAIVKVWEDGQ